MGKHLNNIVGHALVYTLIVVLAPLWIPLWLFLTLRAKYEQAAAHRAHP